MLSAHVYIIAPLWPKTAAMELLLYMGRNSYSYPPKMPCGGEVDFRKKKLTLYEAGDRIFDKI